MGDLPLLAILCRYQDLTLAEALMLNPPAGTAPLPEVPGRRVDAPVGNVADTQDRGNAIATIGSMPSI